MEGTAAAPSSHQPPALTMEELSVKEGQQERAVTPAQESVVPTLCCTEQQLSRAGSRSGTMEPSELGLAFKITFICQPVKRKQASLMEFVDVPEENILPPYFLLRDLPSGRWYLEVVPGFALRDLCSLHIDLPQEENHWI